MLTMYNYDYNLAKLCQTGITNDDMYNWPLIEQFSRPWLWIMNVPFKSLVFAGVGERNGLRFSNPHILCCCLCIGCMIFLDCIFYAQTHFRVHHCCCFSDSKIMTPYFSTYIPQPPATTIFATKRCRKAAVLPLWTPASHCPKALMKSYPPRISKN